MDIICPCCGKNIITDKEVARKVWARFEATKATTKRQLKDAVNFVKNMNCKCCLVAPEPEPPKATTKFSYPAPTLKEKEGEEAM
jgi:hypothetical protein